MQLWLWRDVCCDVGHDVKEMSFIEAVAGVCMVREGKLDIACPVTNSS